ncbi:hypothetical protein J4206_05235 [Candidatus Woesearchaeota archaeon]|nr:hypothetical protein [Candidatus Woesearchaeota archaeon]
MLQDINAKITYFFGTAKEWDNIPFKARLSDILSEAGSIDARESFTN